MRKLLFLFILLGFIGNTYAYGEITAFRWKLTDSNNNVINWGRGGCQGGTADNSMDCCQKKRTNKAWELINDSKFLKNTSFEISECRVEGRI